VKKGFTFEGALSWPFSAPHIASFPWIFAFAFASVSLLITGVVGWLAVDDFIAWINMVEALDPEADPDTAMNTIFGTFGQLIPWYGVSILIYWVVWAVFETASQRRYVRGEGFSLGFGPDEVRMMIVGLLWALMTVLIWILPFGLIFGGIWAAFEGAAEGLNDEEIGQRIVAPTFGAMGLFLLLTPLYIFVATRLAPCFALTVRAREVRFLDAWNVSRGRFWPILGAYVILSICGSLVAQVISGIAQIGLMPAMMIVVERAESGSDIMELLMTPEVLVPLSIYGFVLMFVQGLLQHTVGGPAAFAVRHDPRGGIEQENQLEAFN
jgi:hypothetical protein